MIDRVTTALRSGALVLTILTAPAGAATFYVAPNGNDNNDGLSPTAPVTFTRALGWVNPGDGIEMLAGTYTGGVVIGRPGTAQAWITLKPYNDAKVTIDGSGHAITVYFYRDDFAPMYWNVQGLEIANGDSYAVKIDTPQVRLIGNNLHGSSNDIVKLVATADDVWIYKNEIHHNNAANGANAQAVDIVGADRTWVAYNYVHDIPSIALYSKGNARNTVFENNRVENIYQRGIMLGQSTDSWLLTDGTYETYDGIIRNNVIVNTGGPCLATASSYNVKIYNNSCFEAGSQFNGAIFLSNESTVGQAGTNIEIKNNIVVRSATGSRPTVYIGPNALTDIATLSLDNNIYWTPNGAASVIFAWDQPSGTFWGNLTDWRVLTKQDTKSLIADPAYIGSGDLRLTAASPAIDRGVATPCAIGDFLDKARPLDGNGDGVSVCDIGAYEYDAGVGTVPVLSTNQLPVVSLQSPSNGGTYTAPASIALSAAASDTDGIAKVEFFAGTQLIGSATVAPYTVTWSNVAAGSYNITARATDTLGGVSTSSAVGITVAPAPKTHGHRRLR